MSPRDCQPLLDVATPSLYQVNAFRTLGLDVTATLRDSAKKVDRRRMLVELGQADTTGLGRLELRSPATAETLRAADAVIHNAELRVIHEFFWFWPLHATGVHNDPALKALRSGDHRAAFKIWEDISKETAVQPSMVAIAKHNMAVRWHLTALDLEVKTGGHCWADGSKDTIEKTWKVALKFWKEAISSDAMWNALSARVLALDDERLSLDFVQAMRDTMSKALVKINATLAFQYEDDGKRLATTSHLSLCFESGLCTRMDSFAHDFVVTPLKTRIRRIIADVETHRLAEPQKGGEQALNLLETLDGYTGLLSQIEEFTGGTALLELGDEVARQCRLCAIASYNKKQDDESAIQLSHLILTITRGTELRQQIESDIATFEENQLHQRLPPVLDALKTVEESEGAPTERLAYFIGKVAPALASVDGVLAKSSEIRAQLFDRCARVLRGMSVDAWNKNMDGVTSMAAMDWAERYAVSGEVKKQLAEDRQLLTRLYADRRRHIENEKRKKIAWIVGVVTLVLVLAYCSSNKEGGSPTTSLSTPAVATPTTLSSATPTNDVVPEGTRGDAATYSVPHFMSAELNQDKAALESAQADVKEVETRLSDMQREIERRRALVESARQDLDAHRAQIDRERPQVSSADDLTLQAFNAEVRRYNRSLDAVKPLEVQAEALVDPYNQLAATARRKNVIANGLVNAYNAKLQRYGQRTQR